MYLPDATWKGSCSERSLRRRHTPFLARIKCDGLTQRPRQPLEAGLRNMVVIVAVKICHMQRDARVLGKGLEPLTEQLSVHLSKLIASEGDVPYQIGAARHVDCNAGQGFVHRQMHVGVACDAPLVAERLRKGLPQS